jgi:hypothetical protein
MLIAAVGILRCTRKSPSFNHNFCVWNSKLYTCRYSQFYYWLRVAYPTWSDWNLAYTPKGLWKSTARKLRLVLLFITVLPLIGAWRCRRDAIVRNMYALEVVAEQGMGRVISMLRS